MKFKITAPAKHMFYASIIIAIFGLFARLGLLGQTLWTYDFWIILFAYLVLFIGVAFTGV